MWNKTNSEPSTNQQERPCSGPQTARSAQDLEPVTYEGNVCVLPRNLAQAAQV